MTLGGSKPPISLLFQHGGVKISELRKDNTVSLTGHVWDPYKDIPPSEIRESDFEKAVWKPIPVVVLVEDIEAQGFKKVEGLQEINSMLKPVIMDQHGTLFIFENESEMEQWMKTATELEKTWILKFDCLNDLRNYINRLKQALSDIESMADDAQRQ